MIKLLEPQVPHAERILRSLLLNGVAADQSETGCGKMYVGSYIAKKLNCPVVVICPKAIIPEWYKILEQAGVTKKQKVILINYEKLCRGNTKYLKYANRNKAKGKEGKKLMVHDRVTHESHGIQIKFPNGSLVILDEVHKCKGDSSLNGNSLIALKNRGYRLLLMSATAACDPREMRAFGYATNLHNVENFKHFCLQAGATPAVRYGVMGFDEKSENAKEGMRWVHQNLFDVQEISSRLTREQMRSMFPDNRVFAQSYDMGANSVKIQAVYDQMQAEIDRLDERAAGYKLHVFAEIMKARRMTEILKVPTMVEIVEDLYREGISPVVFVNFVDTIESLHKRLKKYDGEIGLICGGQNDNVRKTHIDEFNADKRRIMLVNSQAGDVGINLHDLHGNYPRGSVISPSWSAIGMVQMLGRIHRANGKTPCIQKILFAAGTIEDRICEKVQSKLENLSLLNDGDLDFGFRVW